MIPYLEALGQKTQKIYQLQKNLYTIFIIFSDFLWL